ncbi:MAG TPA: YbaK/EbsC family protein [Mucilaginibacter sp.]|jgi:Cys-tRNA(Pro)/Cys-tRNA(Cys) deacylase|nr:YbaK/EbsC family protein [Mucilaginibacter sp.]
MHPKVKKVLEDEHITYREVRHDSFSSPINSPIDFAAALNYDLERITKSVFLRSKSKDQYIMAVCSINKKLNLPEVALLSNSGKLEVADKQELTDLVGYPINGVCAIGLDPGIAVFMDNVLLSFPTVLIGSGEAAVEIELAPADLLSASNAALHRIVL